MKTIITNEIEPGLLAEHLTHDTIPNKTEKPFRDQLNISSSQSQDNSTFGLRFSKQRIFVKIINVNCWTKSWPSCWQVHRQERPGLVKLKLVHKKSDGNANLSNRYNTRATTCTDTITNIHNVLLNGCKKDTSVLDRDGFFSNMVIPWYLNGLENSMNSARSGLMVSGATIKSARSATISPMRPVHSFRVPTTPEFEWFFRM